MSELIILPVRLGIIFAREDGAVPKAGYVVELAAAVHRSENCFLNWTSQLAHGFRSEQCVQLGKTDHYGCCRNGHICYL